MSEELNLKSEVKSILRFIKLISPGRRVELRVPPFGVIQCVPGGNHRRGTPANTVEMSGQTLLALIKEPNLWIEKVSTGQVSASGVYSDLSALFAQVAAEYPHTDHPNK